MLGDVSLASLSKSEARKNSPRLADGSLPYRIGSSRTPSSPSKPRRLLLSADSPGLGSISEIGSAPSSATAAAATQRHATLRAVAARAMEAVVVDAGSKLLKAGIAAPDQSPALVMPSKMKLESATAHDHRVHDLSAKVWGFVARDEGAMMSVVTEMLGEFWKVN